MREAQDYVRIIAKVAPLARPSEARYPDYPRLADPSGNILVTVFFGANEDENGELPPESNSDYNAANFNIVSRRLQSLGFRRSRLAPQQLAAFCPKASGSAQTVDEFVRQDRGRQVRVKLLWGTTSASERSMPFYCLLNEAVSRGSMLIYNGHSGLGASLFLQDLRASTGLPFEVSKGQYQIYSYNGCSSYRYYNTDLFSEKRSPADPSGAKNLQVITHGIEGSFKELAGLTLGALEPVLAWSKNGSWASYQAILDSIASEHLTGANGLSAAVERPYSL